MTSIIGSILSSGVEAQMFALGCLTGVLIVALWPNHKETATFLLGFGVAMTLGRSIGPWSPSYSATVQHSPLAAKPWYFLVPIAVTVAVGVPLHRGLRSWYQTNRSG